MAIPTFLDITIDSLGGLGDGIGRHDGRPVFVPKSCAGDRLRIRVTQQAKEFIRGEIQEILSPGPEREKAGCTHFADCGGCSLQQLAPNAYRAFKRKVLADALSHAGFAGTAADVVFLDAATRRRVEFRLQGGKLAFHGLRSHHLVPVDDCIILEPALAALAKKLPALLPSDTSSVSITAADSGIDLLVTSQTKPATAPLLALGIARIGHDDGKSIRLLHETAPITMQLGGYDVALPSDSFLQAAKEGQDVLTRFVLAHAGDAKNIADLFCGIGTYSLPLSRDASVTAFELQGTAVESLAATARQHAIAGFSAKARDLFKHPLTADDLGKFDAVVVNPPRAGAKVQCEMLAKSKVKKIVMISCNPASFARDAKLLKEEGFMLAAAQGLDQFVYSPHLEIAASFTR